MTRASGSAARSGVTSSVARAARRTTRSASRPRPGPARARATAKSTSRSAAPGRGAEGRPAGALMATRSETRVARDERAPRDVQLQKRDEFGGLNWGAAFFGWLVAIGVATLLTAILSAAGAAIGLTKTTPSQASGSADTIGIFGGILLLVVLLLA